MLTEADKLSDLSVTDNDVTRIIRVSVASEMDEFLGKKYVLTESENFEEYLIHIGVGYFSRKVALKLSQTQILTLNDDGTYTYDFISPMANSTITFTPGVEFEEVKADGMKVKSLIIIEDNIMIHTQTDVNGTTSKHVREFYADKMTVTTTAEGLDKIMKRYYVVQQYQNGSFINSNQKSDDSST